MKIDWQSSESHLLQNPKLGNKQNLKNLPSLSGHIWLCTSGTTGEPKFIALSKRAFLVSASAVNQHIGATSKDTWLCSLPLFHVGGLSIFARSHLTGGQVVQVEGDWCVESFMVQLQSHNVSLCSLVPTQLFDLIKLNKKAPESLRVVFVGGGRLSNELFEQAKKLGWPILLTYGMTEACSQVATAEPNTDSGAMKLLSHIEARCDDKGCLELKSESLFTGTAVVENTGVKYRERNLEAWFKTQDLCALNSGELKFLGRNDNIYKVSGELVNLEQLQSLWQSLTGNFNSEVFIAPHPRREHQVELITEAPFADVTDKIKMFNEKVPSIENIKNCYRVEKIERTPLGKVPNTKILERLQFSY